MNPRPLPQLALATVVALTLTLASAAVARACPFCSAVSQTLCERISTSDVAVLAELVSSPAKPTDASAAVSNEAIESIKSTFRVLKVYRGEKYVQPGMLFKALYYGAGQPGTKCLEIGLEPKAIQWSLPVELTPRALAYVEKSVKFAPKGTERLQFAEDYLEDAEQLLQEDALNEFAQADYPTLLLLRTKLDHDRLVRWIQNPAVAETRRRLYFTLLGICGTKQDVPVLEGMIRSGNADQMRGLDALLACYLTLGGPQGMPLVEEMFLKKKDADYTQTYSAIMAVRFHGQQADIIPRNRAIAALRLMLDRPQLADLVIPDLARWEDWESVDRLVELFKTSTKEWSYVRVPIINFLRACPRPEAKAKLDELAKLDPESFRRAASFFPFGGSAPAPATKPETTKKPAAKTPASKTPTAGKADSSNGAQLKAVQWTNSAAPTLAAAPPAAESGTIENAPPKPGKKLVAPRDREELASRYTVGQLRAMVVGVPIVAAAALLGMFWWILHAPRRAAAKSTG